MIRRLAPVAFSLGLMAALPAMAQQQDRLPPSADAVRPQQPQATAPTAGQDPVAGVSGGGATRADYARATAQALIGLEAESKDNKELGDVIDAIVDGRTGAVQSIIVQVKNVQGMEGKNIQVPFSHVIVQPSSENIVVNLPEQQFSRLPQWDYQKLGDGMVALQQPTTSTQTPSPQGR